MKSINVFLLAALFVAATFIPMARAVTTQKVTHDTFEEFTGGEFENISLSSDGHMQLAPAITNIATATDPVIWAMVQDKKGNIYFGTGNQGKVYKLSAKGELSTFFEPNAVMVHALAIDGDGHLYAATSPHGCVYRIDSDGHAEVFCNPGETYIWAMVFGKDDSLFLATGDHGKILRVPGSGSTPAKAETYFETKEANITSLALDNDGNLLAGSSPHGYLYRINKANHGFVVFNSGDKEIKQIAVAPDGVIYASTFVSNPKSESGSSGPITISISGMDNADGNTMDTGVAHKVLSGKSQSSGAENNDEISDATVVQFGEQSAIQMSSDESSDGEKAMGSIYRIDTNGFCQHYWSAPGEAIYSMILLADGTLLAGTGNKGRIYSIEDANHWKLLQETSDGAQVAALLPDARHEKRFYAATSNPGNIYRLDLSLADSGTYTCAAFDAKQKSQWGKLHPDGEATDGTRLEFSTRSGNTPKPDKTWSDWSEPKPLAMEIANTSPNARYMQYRLHFKRDAGSPGATASLRRLEFYYQNLNAPPVISRIKVHNEGFGISKMPMPEIEGQSANLNQLLGSDGKSSRPGAGSVPEEVLISMLAQPPLKMTKSPGYCTVVWEAKDPNNDKMIYSVYIRAASDKQWTTLIDKTTDAFYSFDTTGFHEGLYFIKVTASDLPSNTPETAATTEAISEAFQIANTPPVLTAQSQEIEHNHARVVVNAVDPASPILAASYWLDGKDEVALRPDDLIFDSTNETFTIELNDLNKGNHSLLVRAEDEAKNAAVLKLNFESR